MAARTVLGNVEYPLLGSRMSKADRRAKAARLLKLVGLAEYADTYPSQLSGGKSSGWRLPVH